ncbi:hypothetical protein B0J14DRAFT_312543 [Halenospora varia]|nr:hypothetical protein B0J14DRAFT_312543 [Halenospora varia]
MMETAGALISLQGEIGCLIQAIHRGEKFTCFGKSINGNQCGNKLGRPTHKILAILLEDIIELLQNAGKGVETLLKESSSLVMCTVHQSQATEKFKEWSERIPARISTLAYDRVHVEKISSAPTAEPSQCVTPSGSPSKEQKVKSTNVVDTQQLDQNSSPESALSSFTPDFDDSGLQSGNEEDFFGNEVLASMIAKTAASSSSAEDAAPRTPQRATKPASTDSGISMSFEKSDEAQTKRSIKHRDGSESPVTRKVPRAKRVTPGTLSLRPAPTPVQPRSLSIRPKRKFLPFENPFIKMKNYISKPLLGKNDMKEGYIYGFQVEGCAYTKIGYAAERKSEPSLEASFDARMKEHKRSGSPDLKVVLKKRVPHALRVEKLIHYHLETGRMKEQCSCKGSSGRTFDHGNHTEWFNNSLDEIYTVVIAWKHWILSMPYVELDGGRHHLNSEWKSYLKNIPIQNGHDHWLEWLCQNLPELPRSINKAALDTSEWIENENTTQGHGSFVRNSTTGNKVEIKRAKTCLL